MNKHLLLELIYGLILLTIFSCSNQEEKSYKIGFSQCVTEDAWRKQMHEEMYRELSFHPNLELTILDAKSNNETQVSQINDLIESGIDLLIVSPNEADPITPAVEKAFNNGIPVIVIDRRTSSDLYSAYVGADNLVIGQIAGHYIKNLNLDSLKIAEIWGLVGSTPAISRHRGLVEGINDSSVNILPVYADWTKSDARRKFKEKLAEHPDINVVFAHNDSMALGAYEVARDFGMAENIKILGVDALPGDSLGVDLVNKGILVATFMYPTGGDEAIDIAHKILNGQAFIKENILPTTIVDSTNVRIVQMQNDEIISNQKDITQQQERISEQVRIYKNQRILLIILSISLTASLLLAAYAIYTLVEKQKINRDLKEKNTKIQQQKEEIEVFANKYEEATKAKFQFFTNLSHEIRTPLTLILGPVDHLLSQDKFKLDKSSSEELQLVKKNAYRLLRLINQLMDFRKIENNKMKLKVSENNIVAYLKEIKQSFDHVAEEKKIDYTFRFDKEYIPVYFDVYLFDKTIFNLLSNAFKFTKKQGYVHLSIKDSIEEVIITVDDNGRGMDKYHLNHVFDRFYQGEQKLALGTGLGLSFTNEIVNLHHGKITVESELNLGTKFVIQLKKGKDHFSNGELSDTQSFDFIQEESKIYTEELVKITERENTIEVIDNDKPSIVLIEDNSDVVNMLEKALAENYQVFSYSDGESGISGTLEKLPDIVISDVMMPGGDGISITKKLKADYRTSHIPVILLTARSQEEHKITGLKSGADAYITKPFNMDVLNENIASLIKNRELMKSHFQKTEIKSTEVYTSESLEEKFLKKFKSIVKENLGNPDFGVKDICYELGFSRVQLYRKVKALLGTSVLDYINDLRLSKAKELIQKSDLNISEIAYESGFSSPGYFSTAFRNKYHVSPTEFKASLKL